MTPFVSRPLSVVESVQNRIDIPPSNGYTVYSRKHGAPCTARPGTTFNKRPSEAEKVGVKRIAMHTTLPSARFFCRLCTSAGGTP